MRDHFVMLATYNRRANAILYDAVETLSETEYRRARKAFFTSIEGTLNHILTGDRIWMTRFEGGEICSTRLDAITHPTLASLRQAREAMDAHIQNFVETRVDADFLAGTVRYVNNAGTACADPVSVLLPHLFNHQTHHRGQVHDMLSQTDVPPPSLDMHRVILPV